MSSVVGWCDCYSGKYPVAIFTSDKKRALVDRIRKRRYEFNHMDHCFLPYCCPVYDDKTVCELNKPQWDSVMSEAYKDIPRGARLIPMDIITRKPKNGVLYEAEKFEPKGGGTDG